MTTKWKRNLYSSEAVEPFKVSRSALEFFLECPRCFYLDRKLGISRPSGLPFTLNSAVDELLKKEFDHYRSHAQPHPLMVTHGISAIPFSHPELNRWRTNSIGIQFFHAQTNFMIVGAVDDVWVNQLGELIVVDYKATAKKSEITVLDQAWHAGYKRQVEIYQWLLRQNKFKVSNTGYWVYANGDKSCDRFDSKLHFRMTVISHEGNDSWIEGVIGDAKNCLESSRLPDANENCEYCSFRTAADAAEKIVHIRKG